MGSQPRTSMSAANINKQRFESLANKAKVKSEIREIMPKGFEGAAPVGGWHKMAAFGTMLSAIFALLFTYKSQIYLTIQPLLQSNLLPLLPSHLQILLLPLVQILLLPPSRC